MSRRLAGNVIWNWSGMAVTMVTGFIVAPVLVHRLTDSVYGLWILIASMSGYFGLLDLGVRGSVGRYIAFYRARGEQRQMNVTLSTAVTILTGVAVLTLLATLLVLLVFFHLFDVPEVYVGAARLAIIIIGINLAITFPVSVFDGVLWGHERFDLLNAADIPVSLLRLVLTVWLVQGPNDIVTLAWITLLTTAGNELAKVVMSFRINPGLRLSFRLFERASAVQLYGYGLWQFVLQIARQIGGQLGPLLIGGIVSVSAVTPYSIASRLITYLSQFIVAATGVLTPLATTLHARSDVEREQQLYVQGGQVVHIAGAAGRSGDCVTGWGSAETVDGPSLCPGGISDAVGVDGRRSSAHVAMADLQHPLGEGSSQGSGNGKPGRGIDRSAWRCLGGAALRSDGGVRCLCSGKFCIARRVSIDVWIARAECAADAVHGRRRDAGNRGGGIAGWLAGAGDDVAHAHNLGAIGRLCDSVWGCPCGLGSVVPGSREVSEDQA